MIAIDNLGNRYDVTTNGSEYVVNKNDIKSGAEYIDIIDDSFFAESGDEGYYVIADVDKKGSRLCYFNHKEDGEMVRLLTWIIISLLIVLIGKL